MTCGCVRDVVRRAKCFNRCLHPQHVLCLIGLAVQAVQHAVRMLPTGPKNGCDSNEGDLMWEA